MAWNEQVNLRTRTGKTWQNSSDPNHFAIDSTIAPVHYESTLDSGVFDTEIDMTPKAVNNASLNGWIVTANDWHYALGRPKSGIFNNIDGVVGFGGRKGQNWLKFRLEKVGYLHWSDKAWQDIGGTKYISLPHGKIVTLSILKERGRLDENKTLSEALLAYEGT